MQASCASWHTQMLVYAPRQAQRLATLAPVHGDDAVVHGAQSVRHTCLILKQTLHLGWSGVSFLVNQPASKLVLLVAIVELPAPALRCPLAVCTLQAMSVVKAMGPIDNMEVAGPTLSEVIDCWMTTLQQQPHAAALSYAAKHQLLMQPGGQQVWPRPCVWSALKTVIGMLQVGLQNLTVLGCGVWLL